MSTNVLPRSSSRGVGVAYWIVTGMFCLMMTFSAYAYLTTDMMAKAFQHLGFPSYFRVELAIAKLLGVAALLAPVPARVKEWAYAGFGITILSAIVAHSSTDGPQTAVMPLVAFVMLAASYVLKMKRDES